MSGECQPNGTGYCIFCDEDWPCSKEKPPDEASKAYALEFPTTLEVLQEAQGHAIWLHEGALFLGMPVAWITKPAWVCPHGHVSSACLKSECPSCRRPVLLMPPKGAQ